MANNEVYNFSPGPAMLPRSVLKQVQAEMFDWQGRGVSVLEVSHRSDAFMAISDSLHRRVRSVLAVPDDYHILFAHGGATLQFASLPMNLAAQQQGAYLVTGHWSRKAYQQAAKFGVAKLIADNHCLHGKTITPMEDWNDFSDAAYLYYTDNETVHGLNMSTPPDCQVPVVCDMTSSLLTEPIDYSKFDVILASAQKNIGAAGLTIIIIRQSLCDREPMIQTPNTLNYSTLVKTGSMPNTPCTFAWYVADLVCAWVESEGGVVEMARRKAERAKMIYDTLEQSDLFMCDVDPEYRSVINPVFFLSDEARQADFIAQAHQEGLHSIKGHRVVGGCRASMYNAMPVAGAKALSDFMRYYEQSL